MRRNKQIGFTLVELLTVVAIIALLIGVLIPSLSAARTAARKSTTRSLIDAIGKGCELFNTETGAYPQSRGDSPFHGSGFGGGGSRDVLFGAQWVALQLSGADLQGYVDPAESGNDTNQDGEITANDWNEWYALEPDRAYTRSTYVTASQGKIAATWEQLVADNVILDSDPDAVSAGQRADWIGTEQVPMYIDAWKQPVLYYRATPGVEEPFTTGVPGTARFSIGVYDQTDNGGITGTDGSNGQLAERYSPVRFSQQPAGKDHPMGVFMYEEDDDTYPDPGTFEWWMADRKAFEITKRGDRGKIAPYNRESFILVSAGPDGVYGSADDIWNFTR